MATTSLVEWRSWGRAAFEEARAGQVPVLLALGPGWCPAGCGDAARGVCRSRCRRSAGTTGSCRSGWTRKSTPDVADRYGLGAWPTTAFLTPGRSGSGRGDLRDGGENAGPAPARRRRVRPAAGRDRRARRVACRATRRSGGRPARFPDVDAWVGDHLLARFDEEHGGFGGGGEAGPRRRPRAGVAPGRGGRRGVRRGVRTHAPGHGPGRALRRARRRRVSATARVATGPRRRPRSCSPSTPTRSASFCCPDDDGCPRSGHRRGRLRAAHARRPGAGPPPGSSPASEATPTTTGRGRRRMHRRPGRPPSTAPSTADGTALMARAFAAASETLRDSSLLEFAVDAMEHVVAGTYERGGGIAHRAGSRTGVRGLLTDQVRAAAALLDLHALTDREVYLDMAQELMHFAIQHLWDPSGGRWVPRPRPRPGGHRSAAGAAATVRRQLRGGARAPAIGDHHRRPGVSGSRRRHRSPRRRRPPARTGSTRRRTRWPCAICWTSTERPPHGRSVWSGHRRRRLQSDRGSICHEVTRIAPAGRHAHRLPHLRRQDRAGTARREPRRRGVSLPGRPQPPC